MPQTDEKHKIDMGVCEFYEGKSVFITGATGIVGSVMIEILLRCCPGISSIYILMRPKKGQSAEARMESLLHRKIYNFLRIKRPEDLHKVHMLEGDVTAPYLGLNDDDVQKIIDNVSIVFHCAANITFNKKLRYILMQNVLGTQHVLDICKKMKKLEVIVYTSTYAANCFLEKTEERVYELPFTATEIVAALKNKDEDVLSRLISGIEFKWANTYTFSKCVSENLMVEHSQMVPTVIIRPSVIAACWKGSFPGYVEGKPGMIALLTVVAKGFARVLPVSPESTFTFIPVDIVANTHIVAAWAAATARSPPVLVINCLSHESDVSAKTFLDLSLKTVHLHPYPKAVLKASLTMCDSSVSYWAHSIVEHYVPAIAIDALTFILGKKPKMFSLYRTYDRSLEHLKCFFNRRWICSNENFKGLRTYLQGDEKEAFYMDVENLNLQDYFETFPEGATEYDWSFDKRSKQERARIIERRTLFVNFVKVAFLTGVGLIFYKMLSNIIQVLGWLNI